MKRLTGWIVLAAIVATAGAANAQVSARYIAVSDVGGPYAAMPPELPGRGYGPVLLPPQEVYTVLRESGFSPLGIPRQRGFVYVIAVVDRGGESGRLVIDARNGQIRRFVPGYPIGGRFDDTRPAGYGPATPQPPVGPVTEAPKPPKPASRLASRTPPVPKPSPLAARPTAQPAQQSAAVQAKPAETPATPPVPATAAAPVSAKPEPPQIAPTQEMPKAMGLE